MRRFEDIKAWQKARDLAKVFFELSQQEVFLKERHIRTQMLRSAGSIMDNIAEGFERGGNKEFIQFLFIAKGSAGEFRSQLYRCKDFNMIDEEKFSLLFGYSEEISKMTMALIQYLKKSPLKGDKYS
ncbi:MAG: four helix bundle protein [Bacteroidia bacterium]